MRIHLNSGRAYLNIKSLNLFLEKDKDRFIFEDGFLRLWESKEFRDLVERHVICFSDVRSNRIRQELARIKANYTFGEHRKVFAWL